MKDQIEKLKAEAKKFEIRTKEQLEKYRLEFLSKKGKLNAVFEEFKKSNPEEKKSLGQLVNQLKIELEEKFSKFQVQLNSGNQEKNDEIDFSLPGDARPLGSRHPLSIVQNQIISIFDRMGFIISEGPEIEDDWHNFSALNFPENHPARDMQDTFFVEKDMALRTHTSSVQVRVMQNQKPPIRTISPGRVYRNEAVSARANCFFHQVEGLYINKNVSFADLKLTLFQFVEEFFGKGTEVRFRPSYFPFTEPSAEMDIFLGTGSEEDIRLTKGTGWLEILGCGMVDENVLKNCGIDTETYSGYAFGMGIERIAMLKYGIKDLRLFFENDIRLLNQFEGVL
jgi:phenylalanyl-tRNA synthetase alpha chain